MAEFANLMAKSCFRTRDSSTVDALSYVFCSAVAAASMQQPVRLGCKASSLLLLLKQPHCRQLQALNRCVLFDLPRGTAQNNAQVQVVFARSPVGGVALIVHWLTRALLAQAVARQR